MKYIGLNDKEVITNRDKYGINELEVVKKKRIINKIIDIFKEPMLLLLIMSTLIYFVLGEISDGILMLVFVLVICGIEFIQEEKTSKALEILNSLKELNVKVIRNKKVVTISSRDVVVNDILVLEEGDKIPADAIILECNSLGVNESILTGESQIVYKKINNKTDSKFKDNICYSGCDIVNGNAIAKVINVGKDTEYGKIGVSLNDINKNITPLDKQVRSLVKICSIISFIFCISVIIISYINTGKITSSILSGITIAMATIPEEIPVVLTVFLAMGAWTLAKKKTLTRNMKAVETLGAVTVLCTDKTGTLTENKMKVKEVYSNSNSYNELMLLSINKNPFDPTEIALKEYSYNKVNNHIMDNDIIYTYPFNNEDKMMGQIWNIDNKKLLVVKGSSESVLPLCKLNTNELSKINKKILEYSKKGYRVLTIAKYDNVKKINDKLQDYKLEFSSLVALVDPIRKGIKENIKSCYEAGIRVIMITGDNGVTASSIGKEIGLKNTKKVVTGDILETMSDDELKKVVKDTSIFARVYPNHKYRIVKALQENNEIVAMTGDGVNDATALKKADIGISFGSGTNISKEASDIILMDDDFNTIIDAIKNGRTIYENIKKSIYYIFIIHIPIALSSLIIPLFNLPTLLLPIHIVLLELIIDPTSSVVFQRLKPDDNIMRTHPRKLNEPLISKDKALLCIIQGLLIFVVMFGVYYYFIDLVININLATTISFSTLIISNVLLVYSLISDKLIIYNIKEVLKDNVNLIINLVIFIMLILIIYVPGLNSLVNTCKLKTYELLLVIVLSILTILPYEFTKLRKYNIINKRRKVNEK